MRSNILLVFITILFLCTRLIYITKIPASVYWDEASIGYNAFSIANYGIDEWGDRFPIHFRAFGEFKLPVYIYSVSFLIKLGVSNDLAVRLPSVLYNLISLLLIYLFAEKIFKSKISGLLSAFLFVVLPWNFIFSRTGYEASAGLMFYLATIYFGWLLIGTKKTRYLFILLLTTVMAVYSYNSFRILTPIIFLIIGIMYSLNTRRYYYLILSASFLALTLVPIYRLYKYDFGSSRYGIVREASFLEISKNVIKHIHPDFLFLNGDSNLRSNMPGYGELYIVSFPLFVLGLINMLKDKKKVWLLAMIILGLFPAIITKESPHALRSLGAFPFFIFIIVFGMKFINKWVLVGVVALFYLFFETLLTDLYLNYNRISGNDWQIKYKQISTNVVSDKYAQPYIFVLYYNKISPYDFLKTVKYNDVNDWGFSKVKSFNNYLFIKDK